MRLETKTSLITLLILSLFGYSASTQGISGLISIPNAYFMDEASVRAHLYRGYPVRRGTITATPFDWLEASIFYTSIENLPYPGSGFRQSYKDKGFNAKIRLFNETEFLPSIAFGLNDFAGTGLFSSEYLVASKKIGKLSATIGMGWGDMAYGKQIDNPLIRISDGFNSRRSNNRTGSFNPSTFFSGKKASLFYGVKYTVNKNIALIAERDPFNKNKRFSSEDQFDSDYNFGIKFSHNNNNFLISYERGREVNFSYSLDQNFINFSNSKGFKKTPKKITDSRRYLQKLLEENDIGLVEIKRSKSSKEISFTQNSYLNYEDAEEKVLLAVKHAEVAEGEDIILTHKQLGMTMRQAIVPNKSSYNLRSLSEFENTNELERLFYIKEQYPYFKNQFSVKPRFMIAAREDFLFSGLLFESDSELILNSNLIITSNLKYSLIDDFDGLFIEPRDTFPNQVRSDIKKYLNELGNGISVGRLQLDYYGSNKNHFYKLTGGIFEEMFSGMGLEYVYSPQNSLFSVGLESFYVKKRDYKMRFSFKDYDNTISRINFSAFEPQTRILSNISYGEYLAGDIGTTYRFTKIFRNNVTFGFFLTFTDVSFDEYGEGSFDKGIYVTIPFRSFLSSEKNLTSFDWRPLTKDPGALLIKNNELISLVNKFRF